MKSKTNPTSKNISDIEQVKLDLLSLVSYELKTPLHTLTNALELLKSGELGVAETQAYIGSALQNARKLQSTLDRLVDLSKLVTGRLECRFHEVGFQNLISASLNDFLERAQSKGIKVEVSGLPLPLPVLCDLPRIEQILRNLFETALSNVSSGKLIHLQVSNDTDIRLELSYSAVPSFEPDDESVAKEVMKQHGGVLKVSVEPATRLNPVAQVSMCMELPRLEGSDALSKAFESRIARLKEGVSSVSLMLLSVRKQSFRHAAESLGSALFRASDTIYSLPDDNHVAVLMEDCKKSNVPKLLERLLQNLGTETLKFVEPISVAVVSYPEDGSDAKKMLAVAQDSLKPLKEFLSSK